MSSFAADALRIPAPAIALRCATPSGAASATWPVALVAHAHDALRLELRALFRALSSMHGVVSSGGTTPSTSTTTTTTATSTMTATSATATTAATNATAPGEAASPISASTPPPPAELRPAHLRAFFAWYDALEAFAVAVLKAEEETIYPWIEQWGRIEGPLSTSARSQARGRIIRHVRDISSLAASVPVEVAPPPPSPGGGVKADVDAGRSGRARSSKSANNSRTSAAPFYTSASPESDQHPPPRRSSLFARRSAGGGAGGRGGGGPGAWMPFGRRRRRRARSTEACGAASASATCVPLATDATVQETGVRAQSGVGVGEAPAGGGEGPLDSAALERAAAKATMSSSRGLRAAHDGGYYLPLSVVAPPANELIVAKGAAVGANGVGAGAGGAGDQCRNILAAAVRHSRLMARAMLAYFEHEERYLPPVIDALYDESDVGSDGIERSIWRAIVRNNRRSEAAILMMRACPTSESASAWASTAMSALDRLQLPLWRRRMATGRNALMCTLLALAPPERTQTPKTPYEEQQKRQALLYITSQQSRLSSHDTSTPKRQWNDHEGPIGERMVSGFSALSGSGRLGGSGRLDGANRLHWSGKLAGKRPGFSRSRSDRVPYPADDHDPSLVGSMTKSGSSAMAMPSPRGSPRGTPSAQELLHQLGSQPAHWDGSSDGSEASFSRYNGGGGGVSGAVGVGGGHRGSYGTSSAGCTAAHASREFLVRLGGQPADCDASASSSQGDPVEKSDPASEGEDGPRGLGDPPLAYAPSGVVFVS